MSGKYEKYSGPVAVSLMCITGAILVFLTTWYFTSIYYSSPEQREWREEYEDSATQSSKGYHGVGALDGDNEGGHSNAPCGKGQNDRNSDLCAQWKAADAANDAAYWTQGAFWAAATATGITFLALIAAGAAAWFTHKTVAVAREIGQAQVRTYLSPNKITIIIEAGVPYFEAFVKNTGASPANDVHVICHALIGRKNGSTRVFSDSKIIGTIGANSIEEAPRGIIKISCEDGQIIVFTFGIFGRDVFGWHVEEFITFPIMVPSGGNMNKSHAPGYWNRLPYGFLDKQLRIADVETELRSRAWSGPYLEDKKPKKGI